MLKHPQKRPLKWRLFGYMTALAALLLVTVVIGLVFIGKFGGTKKEVYGEMEIQLQVFARELDSHFDTLSYEAIRLSGELSAAITDVSGPDITALTDDSEAIRAVETAMFEPLRQKLLQSPCSGVFAILEATINTGVPGAADSRCGLYLQPCGSASADVDILLYRGISDVGREEGAMPHRKWRQEFAVSDVPGYRERIDAAVQSLAESLFITDAFLLPGTSERAVLLIAPILGDDGNTLGLCGFEINESYFKQQHAQATNLERLSCVFARREGGELLVETGLGAGSASGYYLPPTGTLSVAGEEETLQRFSGGGKEYVGAAHRITPFRDHEGFTVAALIPFADYRREAAANAVQLTILLLLAAFFALTCCLFFTKRFLKPVLAGLEMLKGETESEECPISIPEIDDLFRFLAAKDRAHEEAIHMLIQEKEEAVTDAARLETEREAAEMEVARLAYQRDKEIDPDDYARFLEGIKSLTPAEQNVFRHYLAGRSAKEIEEALSIKESTLRYHNRNIYQKLGVNSLKQMLRYAALMKQRRQEEEKAGRSAE